MNLEMMSNSREQSLEGFSKFQSSKRLALDSPTLGSKLSADRMKNKWCYLVSGLINGFQTSSASLITFEIASSGSG